MATGVFPPDPNNRKTILILRADDIIRCGYEPDAFHVLRNEEVYVLQFPIVPVSGEMPLALQNILDSRHLVRPGNLLVQNPYDQDNYKVADSALQEFATEKYMYFSTLCMYLGATEVRIEQLDWLTHEGKITFTANGGRLGGKAGASIDSEEMERFKSQISVKNTFSGGPVNIPAAESLLRKIGLWADVNMRTLIDLRRSNANLLQTHDLVLNLSTEAKRSLNVAARLVVPEFIELSANYKQIAQETKDYTLTVSVRF